MTRSSILLRIFVFLCYVLPLKNFGQSAGSQIPFTYNLSGNARTSAGVYKVDVADTILIRTLWSGEQKAAGIHTAHWDGKNDSGVIMPNGLYYTKVLSNNVQYQWQGVVGNNSQSFSGATVYHSAQMINSMVQVNNTMYYSVGYNEGQNVHQKFQLDNPNIVTTTLKGDGQIIRYLATDGIKVYSAGQSHDKFFITGLNANPTGMDVLSSFSAGTNIVIKSHTYSSFGIVQSQNPIDGIFGLAVQTSGDYLFAAYTEQGLIKTFNKTTGAFIVNNSFTKPKEIALQGENNIWIITGTNTVAKHSINSNGTIGSAVLTLTGLTNPLALAVSPDGNKIVVADRGSVVHQVKVFNTTTGASLSILGRNEGYSNPTVYDDKFYFSNTRIFNESDYGASHCFLQYQSDGSLWVGDYGNMRCQHFSSSGMYINNIQYMGYSYSSQTDINNPTRVFSDFLEFKVDYSKPLAPNNGSWKFVRNWSKNLTNAAGYDANRMRSVATLNNNRTYALYSNALDREVIELDTVVGIRHTTINLDNARSDMNSDGSQWQIGTNEIGLPTYWQRKPLTGFDGNNNPVWGSHTTLETTPPITAVDPVTADGYLKRNQITTSNAIVAFSSDNSNFGRAKGWHLGGVKNGKWLWKTSPATHRNYRGLFPLDGAYDIGNGVNNAGSFMQVVEKNIFWGYTGEFWKNSQVNKYNHYYENGLFVGQFGVSGDEARESGIEAYPGMAGNANSGTYVKIGNDIYFYHCDEGQHGGVHRWKISDLNTIQEQSVTIIKNGTPMPPLLDYTDLMAGLPFDDTLTNNTAGWTRFAPESTNFSVKTNYGTYKKSENDLRIFSIGQNVDCWVKRELGTNNSLINWKIVGDLAYPEAGEYGDNFMEVLDVNERIIVRLSRPDFYPNLEIKANASRIAFGPDVYTKVGSLKPLSLVANGNSITVSFGTFNPVTISPFDAQADIHSPTTLRFYTVSHPSGHQINVARLKFYKNFGLGSGHFRSKATGLWKNVSSWQSSADSTNWVDATSIPDSSANSIAINGHIITLTDTVTVDQLSIQNTGGLKVAPKALLRINDGPGNDITIAGTASMLIQSDATGTGRIGASSGTVSGNVTVERYISANNNAAYRLLGPSVNTANGPKPFIRNNWQEGQNNTSITANSNNTPNYGMHITGSMMGNNGFDATLTALPSLLYYNQTATIPAWLPIANTDATNFDVKKGYLVYIRGDRSTDLHMNMTTSNTTLRTTGTIATGTQTFTNLEGNGRSSLVTNPYPCPIDWSVIYNDASTANAANFENYYTYWDPNVGISGGYVTVNANGTKSAATNATTEIQPGQAFFIKAKAGVTSPTLTIREDHKSGTGNINVFRTGAREQFRAALYYSDAGSVRRMADAVNAVFDTAYSQAIDGNDAEEMANWDENVGITRNSKMFSIEGRPLIDLTDTVYLSIQRLKMQGYEWQFEPMGFAQPNMKAYLEDKYTNQRVQMNLTGVTVVPFSVNAAPASSAPDRFRIVFAPNSSLPVTMRSIKAYQQGTGVQVEWTVDKENGVDRYEVEKSADGRNFSKAGTVLPNAISNLVNTYTWFDQQPKEGSNYYRIKTIDKNGTVSYSSIVNVKIGGKKGSFEVYPNPLEGNYLTVQFNSVVRGMYTINFINALGQKIVNKVVNHSGGSASQFIHIDGNLPPGSYNVQITGAGVSFNKKIVK